jgi:hypothetical protein
MKGMGNTASNLIYNPTNKKPPVPIDADEADSAMERFIRTKYRESASITTYEDTRDYETPPRYREPESNRREFEPSRRETASGRHRKTASSDSDEHPLPQPPPQKTSRFGFRSASSIFPMSSKAKREAAARQYLENQNQNGNRERDDDEGPTPPRKNKPARIFGTSTSKASNVSPEEIEEKLGQLREMGFKNGSRNLTVLKGFQGNMDKTLETLIRLGERSGPPSRSRTPSTAPVSAGLSINPSKDSPVSPTPSKNPWDMPAAPPQSSQSTGALSLQGQQSKNDNPQQNSLNPFGFATSRSQYNLNQQYTNVEQPFQNMLISPNQPLFPHHTGGAAQRQPFQAAAAPSMPSIPQGQYASSPYNTQLQTQYSPTTNQGYNPFLQQQQKGQSHSLNSTPVTATSPNPFNHPTRNQTFPMQHGSGQLQPQMSMQDYFSSSQQQQQPQQPQLPQPNPYGQNFQSQQQQMPQQMPLQPNPFGQLQLQQQQQQQPQLQQLNPYNQTQPQQQANPYNNFQQQPQLVPQQTGRADKSSIMALYSSYPQSPPLTSPQQPQQPQQPQKQQQPQQPQQLQQPQQPQMGNQPQTQTQNPYQPQSLNTTQQFSNPTSQSQQPNISSPLSSHTGFGGSKNPFMHSTTQPSPFPPATQNQSNGTVGNAQGGLLAASGIGGIGNANGGGKGRHASQESMSVDPNGWHVHSGRHSPDAFASLSARAVR